MDRFSICLNGFCLIVQGGIHICFCSKLTGKKQRIGNYAGYTVLLCILDRLADQIALPWLAVMGAQLLILYGANRFLLGNCPPASRAAAILAVYMTQFSFGIINSVESVLFPCAVGMPLLYLLVAAAAGISFAVCAACCVVAARSISPEELDRTETAAYLLCPVLFLLVAQLYVMQTAYTQVPCIVSHALQPGVVGRHTALLFFQSLGSGALFCTLYVYRRLCRSQQAQAELQTLTHAVQAQKLYISEAQMRYEQTKALRHDMKNHLSVLNGLLANGDLEASRAWLQKLDAASARLSFPYQTGEPVVDILLGEKLELARTRGVTTEVSLILPGPSVIDELDLCVIFANALDNAIQGCQSAGSKQEISIRSARQGDFYLLTFENTCGDTPLPPPGTGLSNIKSVAEKYHGAMLAEKARGRFSLNVLLNISLHPGNISARSH